MCAHVKWVRSYSAALKLTQKLELEKSFFLLYNFMHEWYKKNSYLKGEKQQFECLYETLERRIKREAHSGTLQGGKNIW